MVEIINDNPLINVEVSCATAKVQIKLGNQTNVDVELQVFIKGEKGDNIEEIIVLNGGENYTLSHSIQGKKYTIIINNPNPIPTVILHPGPNPVGPIHVFAPNASRFTRIEVLYVLGQWIKTF